MTSYGPPAPNDSLRRGDLPPASPLGLGMLRALGNRVPALGKRFANAQAAITWRTSDSVRRGATANAARLAPRERGDASVDALAHAIVRNWYRGMFDAARNAGRDFRDLLPEIDQIVGREKYGRARATGRGLIIATAHVGPFEILAAALRQYEPKIRTIVQRDRNAGVDSLRSDQHRRLGIVEAAVDDGFDVWVGIKNALERDEVVLIHADQVLRGQRGAKVKFAGGHISVPTTPIKLAVETGAPIMPMFAVRTSPSTARVFFESPLKIEPGPSEEGGVHPGVFALAAIVESYAVRYADQWRMVDPLWIEDRDAGRGTG